MTQHVTPLKSRDIPRVRGWSPAGALLTFTALWPSFISPSIFTLVALLIAPALILPLIGVFWPAFHGEKKRLRLYLRAGSLKSAGCGSPPAERTDVALPRS